MYDLFFTASDRFKFFEELIWTHLFINQPEGYAQRDPLMMFTMFAFFRDKKTFWWENFYVQELPTILSWYPCLRYHGGEQLYPRHFFDPSYYLRIVGRQTCANDVPVIPFAKNWTHDRDHALQHDSRIFNRSSRAVTNVMMVHEQYLQGCSLSWGRILGKLTLKRLFFLNVEFSNHKLVTYRLRINRFLLLSLLADWRRRWETRTPNTLVEWVGVLVSRWSFINNHSRWKSDPASVRPGSPNRNSWQLNQNNLLSRFT